MIDPPDPVSASASAYYYLVPSSEDSLVAIGSVEIGSSRLEARYGYEGLRTGSAFVGHRFDVPVPHPFELAITPILGVALGRTHGVVPGVEVEASWWKIELTSESEYLVHDQDPASSFFYNWSELVIRPVDAVFGGFVLQRTRFFRESLTLDPGAVVGCTVSAFTAKAYAFRPIGEDRFYAFALEASF